MLNSGLMLSGGKGILGKSLHLGLRNPLFPWALSVARGQTNRTLYAKYLKDPQLIQILSQLGYPVMDGAFTLGMWASFFYDYFMPQGGMQAFANRFVRLIRERGGQIHLGQQVERILIEAGCRGGRPAGRRDRSPGELGGERCRYAPDLF